MPCLNKNDATSFLDPLKTQLLQEIMQTGSLSGAAKNLKISYQHAWTMIDEMNLAPYHWLSNNVEEPTVEVLKFRAMERKY